MTAADFGPQTPPGPFPIAASNARNDSARSGLAVARSVSPIASAIRPEREASEHVDLDLLGDPAGPGRSTFAIRWHAFTA